MLLLLQLNAFRYFEVHIDEMRTLLEIHYNDLYTERYMRRIQAKDGEERKMTMRRKSEFKVFRSVVCHRLFKY